MPKLSAVAGADELLDAVETFFNVGHAGGVADADAVVGSESHAGHGGDLLAFEQLGAKLHGLDAGPGNVWEEVKGAFGIDAGDAGDAVKPLPGVSAAAVEFRQPARQMVLRPVQRRHRPLLRERSRIARAVALNGVDGPGDRLRRRGHADAPAGHGVSLGQPMNNDGLLVVTWRKRGDADVLGAVI